MSKHMTVFRKPAAARRAAVLLSGVVTGLALLASSVIGMPVAPGAASSHREAPLISRDPTADNTDTYVFVSPDRTDSVTLIGSWIPLEEPAGGPNFYSFDDNVLYELHVDNVGDGKSHITYQFTFHTTIRNPNTFLYNTGPIMAPNYAAWNIPQTYTVTEVISRGVQMTTTVLGANLAVPPVNVGEKSTPNYEALFNSGIHTIGSGNAAVKVFAGQTDDPFWVDTGSVFDLLTLRNQLPPIGYSSGRTPGIDGLAGYNVHSIALQVPIARLLATAPAGETVIGVWASASRHSMRVLGVGSLTESGPFVQVSRLGMPLVNEVVMPLALKDVFNGLKPEQDLSTFLAVPLLQRSVLTPELQSLLGGLYGVPNPGKPRQDIFDIFLTGISTTMPFTINTPGGAVALPAGFNVNKFTKGTGIQPAEMIRLNTAIKPGVQCGPAYNYQLGLLGGDACGFPNGRRLQDDVTEIELLAVAGAAWPLLTGDNSFHMNPGLIDVLTDSVNHNDKPFRPSFPYLASPHSGQTRVHA